MNKLNPNYPAYSQVKVLLSEGDGPWQIKARSKEEATAARASCSQIGKQQGGIKYSTSVDGNHVITIKRVEKQRPIPEAVVEWKDAAVGSLEELNRIESKRRSTMLSSLDDEIERRAKNVNQLTQDLAEEKAGLKALLSFKEQSAPF